MNAATLRTLADLVDQGHPVEYAGIGANDSVTLVVSNEITAIKLRERLDERRVLDAVVIVLAPIGVPS